MVTAQRLKRWVAAVGVLASIGLAGALAAPAALAQDATPVGSSGAGVPPLPPGCSVVAQGLVNPRYIAVGDDGSLYVSEAGTGGNEPIFGPPAAAGTGTPAAVGTPAPQPIGSRGLTGQVTKIATDGKATVVVKGLPSYNVEGPIGPSGIVFSGGKIWLAIGGGAAADPSGQMKPLPNENSVVSIDPASGTVTQVADIGAFEKANNPQAPHAVDANLYGMKLGADGKLYLADAGGNTVFQIDPATGALKLLAVIPGIPFPQDMGTPTGGNPERGGKMELDPVPTDAQPASDGSVYVSLLSGFPFPPGAARVQKIGTDGKVSDVATGLTMVVGLAMGPGNALYASELTTNFGAQPPAAGNIVRIKSDGSSQIVVANLALPNGIAFDKDGNLNIVVNTVSFGPPGTPPAGQVLKCSGIAGASGGAAASPAATPVAVNGRLGNA